MSRRLAYVALAITSFVLAACAQPTAPSRGDSNCVIYQGSSGHCGS